MLKRIFFVVWADEHFGGAERRYCRLAKHLSEDQMLNVKVLGSEVFFNSISKMGITFDDSVRLVFKGHYKNRYIRLFFKLIFFMNFLFFKRNDHVHLCVNPGILTFLYSLFFFALPKFSFSMNAGLFSYNASFLTKYVYARHSVARAVSVDCLGPRYRHELSCFISQKLTKKLCVAPCSFLSNLYPVNAMNRDIDVLFLSRLVKWKGLDLLEQASKNIPNINVHVCGRGPMSPEIEGASIYYVENSFDVLQRAKIFLSIQDEDNYPSQALLEAMTAGCAVIATDVGDTRLLLNEANSVLIPRCPIALADAINALLVDPIRRSELGFNARKDVCLHHSVERYAEYFLKCISLYD